MRDESDEGRGRAFWMREEEMRDVRDEGCEGQGTKDERDEG